MHEIIDNFRNHIHDMHCSKKEIHQTFISQLEFRMKQAQQDYNLAKESRDSDTKSSAGDKYETGREMMQREMDKLNASIDTYQQQLSKMKSIDPEKSTDYVKLGTLIETNLETYYISLGLGQIYISSLKIYAISPESPLGVLLIGKRVGDVVELRGRKIIIEQLC